MTHLDQKGTLVRRFGILAVLVLSVGGLIGTTPLPSEGSQSGEEVKLALDFESPGRVTHVGVRPGDRVRRGQVLARVDDTEARAAVAQAEAAVASARAQVDQLRQGMSAEELAEADAAIAQSQAAIDAAAGAYENASESASHDTVSLDAAVRFAREALESTRARVAQNAQGRQLVIDQAARAVAEAQDRRTRDQQSLDAARATLAAHEAEYQQRGCAGEPDDDPCRSLAETIERDREAVAAAEVALANSRAQVTAAQNTLDSARQNDAAGDVEDQRAVLDAEAQVDVAELDRERGRVQAEGSIDQAASNLRAAELARQASEAARAASVARESAATTTELAMAVASLRSAEASLAVARHNLSKTELRAPADGVVVSVSGHVGELSQGGGSDTGGSGAAGDAGFISMITFEGA